MPLAKASIYAHVRIVRLLEEAESFDGLAAVKLRTWIKMRIEALAVEAEVAKEYKHEL